MFVKEKCVLISMRVIILKGIFEHCFQKMIHEIEHRLRSIPKKERKGQIMINDRGFLYLEIR